MENADGTVHTEAKRLHRQRSSVGIRLLTCSSSIRPPISSTFAFMRRIVSVAVMNLL